MIKNIKYNFWVYFEKIRIKKEIKKIEQNLGDCSWHLGVEKIEDINLVKAYKELEFLLFFYKNMLKGLKYEYLI